MKPTLRIGRIAGVEIGVHWTVLGIAVLMTWSLAVAALPEASGGQSAVAYWAVAALTAAAFLASILAHEISHAVVATRSGVRVDGIVLWAFGGATRLHTRSHDPRAERRIALAGPATSIGIGVVALAGAAGGKALGLSGLVAASLAWLGGINLVVAVFNLLPGAPLDGGRVLTAILWLRSGEEEAARRRSALVGRFLGHAIAAVGVVELALGYPAGLWTAGVGLLLSSMARAEVAQSTVREVLADVRIGDVMTPDVVTVPSDCTVANFTNGPWMNARVSTFPVVDHDGRLVGLLAWKMVARIPAVRWPTTPVTAVAAGVDDAVVFARRDDALVDVLGERRDPSARIIVRDGERIVGIVAPSDVARTLERRAVDHEHA